MEHLLSIEGALSLAPWILIVPFLSFVILMTAGRWRKALWYQAHWFAIGGILASLVLSVLVTLAVVAASAHSEYGASAVLPAIRTYEWVHLGDRVLRMGIVLDGLTAVMLLVVSLVATAVQIYSIGYMHGDERYSRFFAYLSLFSGSMLGLVLANNLVQLYIFWELVGLSSYLLIGFWFQKPEAMRAAKKAFIVTRLGDLGFFIGLVLIYYWIGSLQFQDVFRAAHFMPAWIITLAALLLFCGAIGKSAQFPLHVWLPDAMEGPTPVSALIHAATMVAAGVYLVGRMYPLFQASIEPWAPALFGVTLFRANALTVVAWTGAITALLGATIGVLQNDIKRVLAYSTISQLGYMMIGLGTGGFVAGLFHLTTHAFFKALLFLASGSVIIGTHHKQDIMEMGGLWRRMPVTFATFLVGMLSLAGFPFLFSGFYSKEEILLHAHQFSPTIFWMGVLGAFLTAFYMTRLMFLTFGGEPRSHEAAHAHETPWSMLGPLCVLAALSLFPVGRLGEAFHHFVDPNGLTASIGHSAKWTVMLLGSGAGLLGILAGWVLYSPRFGLAPFRRALIETPFLGRRLVVRRQLPLVGRWVPPGTEIPGIYAWVKNKYYFDEIYWKVMVVPLLTTTRLAFRFDQSIIDGFVNRVRDVTVVFSLIQGWVDKYIVDGLVNLVGWITGQVGNGFRHLQTGRVQHYGILAVVGLAVAVGAYLYFGF